MTTATYREAQGWATRTIEQAASPGLAAEQVFDLLAEASFKADHTGDQWADFCDRLRTLAETEVEANR